MMGLLAETGLGDQGETLENRTLFTSGKDCVAWFSAMGNPRQCPCQSFIFLSLFGGDDGILREASDNRSGTASCHRVHVFFLSKGEWYYVREIIRTKIHADRLMVGVLGGQYL